MAQRSGTHALLEIPIVYNFIQAIFTHRKTVNKWNQLVGDFNNKNLLDVGCGPGKDALNFAGANYTGIDFSKVYIDEAKTKYKNYGDFFCCSIENIEDLPKKKFDIVILKGVLHHLDDEQIVGFLLQVQNYLNKNGRIITMDPVITENQGKISRFLISLDRGMHVRYLAEYSNLIMKPFIVKDSVMIKQTFPPYQRLMLEIEKP